MPNIRPLSAELQRSAIEQLGEKPERIDADIEALRTWIKQQPHLRSRTDDQFLVNFLRGCKYSLEKAKAKIDKYYTLRSKYPEMFTCRDYDINRMCEILRTGLIFYLPKPLNDNGPAIVMMRSGIYPAEKYTAEEVLRVTNALHEITMLEDDNAIVNGVVFIGDMQKLSMAHMIQFTPSIIKKMTVYSEEGMPFRPKGTHFLNTPGGFEQIFNIFKPMLSAKQQKRLYVHGSKHELLYEHVPQKYLPKEYGGENGTLDEIIAYWEKKFREYDAHFKQEFDYGTDEKLRPGKPIDFNGMFGIDGSFRKLDVD